MVIELFSKIKQLVRILTRHYYALLYSTATFQGYGYLGQGHRALIKGVTDAIVVIIQLRIATTICINDFTSGRCRTLIQSVADSIVVIVKLGRATALRID